MEIIDTNRTYSLITILRNTSCFFEFSQNVLSRISDRCKALVIIDNHSKDSFKELYDLSIEELESKNKKLKIIRINNKHNLLFTRAFNQGLARAAILDADYYIQCNPDIIFGENKNLLNKREDQNDMFTILLDGLDLYKSHRNPNAGIAGVKLIFSHNKTSIEHAGGMHNSSLGYGEHFNNPNFNEIKEVEWVCGGLICISKEAYSKLGPLEEKLTHWISDQEYCRRAGELGIKTVYFPINFFHARGKSTELEPHEESLLDLPEGLIPNSGMLPWSKPMSLDEIKEMARINAQKRIRNF